MQLRSANDLASIFTAVDTATSLSLAEQYERLVMAYPLLA